MGIILWIVFGALAGWVASALMKNNESLFMNIVIGIVGAVLGGFIMGLFGQSGVNGFNIYSFVVAIVGAVALIAIVRAMRRTT